MEPTQLTIHGGGQDWQVDLNPEGTLIGRSRTCDVVLNSPSVSRRHAKVFWVSSYLWVVKDLNSSNGTFVNGRRVASCPIVPGDVIEIGSVCLSLGEMPERPALPSSGTQMPRIIIEDFGTEIFYCRPRIEECTGQPCAERFKSVCERLSGLSDRMAGYREICRGLAGNQTSAAIVFHVPRKEKPMPEVPQVLASHFGGDCKHFAHHGLRVSHRLLEAVRTAGHPLMTKSIFSCDTEVTISLFDEHSPRALICVPLTVSDEMVNLLYVDVPITTGRTGPGPEEMFAFVQAVAQQVRHTAEQYKPDFKSQSFHVPPPEVQVR